jgi:hypothetical protein
MKITEIKEAATCCVIRHYSNEGTLVFFANRGQAEAFAEEKGGRVVDEIGLAEKFEAMHCAEGRDTHLDSWGRAIEDPEDAETIWATQYTDDAATSFLNATVYEIEIESDEARDVENELSVVGRPQPFSRCIFPPAGDKSQKPAGTASIPPSSEINPKQK